MIRRRIRFSKTARKHLRLLRKWWLENADHPEILHNDLQEAIAMLAALPGIGSPYPSAPVPGVRRFYLQRLTSHLYYTFDQRELIVRAVWHARRGSGPELGD